MDLIWLLFLLWQKGFPDIDRLDQIEVPSRSLPYLLPLSPLPILYYTTKKYVNIFGHT